MIISSQKIEEVKNKIKSNKEKMIVEAQSLEFNRKILEYGKFQSLLIPTLQLTKPFKLKKPQLELDLPCLKSASKNKISISIDINEISKLTKKGKAIALSNLIYLLKLSKKSSVNISFLNIKDGKNISALITSLGGSSQQSSKAITF